MGPAGLTRRRAGRFTAWPIRRKLLALALLPLLGVLPLLGAVLLVWGDAALDRLLITKVRSDLAVAHGYFERVLGEVAASTAAVADSNALHQALQHVLADAGPLDRGTLQALLRRYKAREGLDFINLRDAAGRLLVADVDADAGAVPPLRLPGAAAGGSGERVAAAVAVLPPSEQGVLPPALRERVTVPLLPTRNALPITRSHEDRAMVVRAAAPVRAADGRLLAHVQAGLLLNRNLPFIDHINQIVYPEGALPFGSRGTATLFLDDVRISTNVRLFEPDRPAAGDDRSQEARGGLADGERRAIGTRVSMAVREAVLGRGETWLDRAFVVSDWYVSAYQPLRDADGRRVGMLYVGYLERPFTWLKYGVLAAIGALFFGVMLLAALVSARWARQIFHPLEQMALTMRQVEGGALGARVGRLDSGDEIGALAGHFDRLLDTLADKAAALQRWNAELDAKVNERTRDLQAAQAQLLRSEKMAAVGQLTASIAHEVNNPIAVIQGNLDLARELLGDDAQRVQAELKLIDEQIERMRLIVTQLLQFARPNEYAGYVEPVDTGRALEDCLVLTGHLLSSTGIVVERELRATRPAGINRQELQQVLVNLMVNAIHAMPDGGRLTLRTEDWADAAGPGVCITVADTGPGLSDELLRELFQPFVTRKKDGTGLGLWISRSLVERYGGDIRAGNRPAPEGSGAVMRVLLLSEPAGTG
ncbi:MAG: cache domain-containing protein [Burkholderiaceae bacterium]|nr:cache domain-containing protein [Burkholderiaceae bacterium]